MVASEKINKLALGTAQFGLDYGVSNTRGLVPAAEVLEILKLAAASGVDMLDTAQAYGNSEAVIGSCLKACGARLQVVTKLKDVPAAATEASLQGSLERTGMDKFYGVLLHSYDEYAADRAGYDALVAARERGLTGKTGFSLYHPEQAERLLDQAVDFNLVQVPYSLLDRRFERVFSALKRAGVEIHVRSVFLQGLLLMEPAAIPAGLKRAAPKVEAIHGYAKGKGWTAAAVCAGFALANPLVDRVVIGVDGLNALAANLDGLRALPDGALPGLEAALGSLAETDEDLLLPQNWKK